MVFLKKTESFFFHNSFSVYEREKILQKKKKKKHIQRKTKHRGKQATLNDKGFHQVGIQLMLITVTFCNQNLVHIQQSGRI